MFDLKKLFFCITICLMIAGTAFAAGEFAPTVMEISVDDQVYYGFDESTIEIEANISGVGGAFWLVINTKGKAADINMVQNGYMGWHTVNNIDTTVYISGQLARSTGEATFPWDGRDNDGGAVEAGQYDYYIYGYDNVNSRIPACMYIQAGAGWRTPFCFVLENDENGNPLANPIITYTVQPCGSGEGTGNEFDKMGNVFKWILGGNPDDFNNLQWTNTPIYPQLADFSEESPLFAGGSAFDPTDHDIFHHVAHNTYGGVATLLRWSFVNNGNAILDEDWGGWENIVFEKDYPLGIWTEPMPTVTDGDNLYILDGEQTGVATNANKAVLYCYDFDGEEVFAQNFEEFYMPDDPTGKGNCGLLNIEPGNYNNSMFLSTMGCCMHEFIETTSLMDGDDDEASYLRWRNGQGDFYFDVYWQPDAEYQWACLNNAEHTAHRVDMVQVDKHGFNITFAMFIGNCSYGVQTQDGTSLLPGGLMALADDSLGEVDTARGGGFIIDSGSQFDGMYTNAPPNVEGGGGFQREECWFVATASAHGVISNTVAVEEDAAVAFAVSQNSPNPFNPTTAINFTLPESGNVSVEVFNVAGQKVDTLVDAYMNAGQQNVVWDAAGFSNGVYFYTVKAGGLTKTMKMTLLK